MTDPISKKTALGRRQKLNPWEWLRRYRVWEANRKVFVSPDNYLEPERPDDKPGA